METIITFKIYSIDGKEVTTQKINKSELSTSTINIEALTKGIYFLNIHTGVYSQNLKFVKE
jgi:hypothetical protein